jgi:subtilisin-like proprotein convertase family protein
MIELVGPRGCLYPRASIPDEGTITSTLLLPAHGKLSDVQVSLDIGHTYASDLNVTLTHADTATTVTLFDPSSCSGDQVDIRLDDAAASAADQECSSSRPAFPRDATYRPSQPLSAFDGEDFEGRWTLTISDTAGVDRGTLHAWCLFAQIDPASLTPDVFSNGFE